MAQSQRVRVDGFKELDRALRELPTKMQKTAVRSAMRKTAQRLAEDMGRRLPRSRVHRRHIAEGVEVRGVKQKVAQAVGLQVGPVRRFFYGWYLEKGTSRMAAQPWARPAFAAWARPALEELKIILWKRVRSAAKRLAKRRARGLA